MRAMLRRLPAALLLAALAPALYWSLRLARADLLFRRDSLDGVQQAIRLVPASARYHARLAQLLDAQNADPALASAALRRAHALDPRDSSLLIELGLRAEIQGDLASAENLLLQAAAADRMFEPRWTLANFYFRRASAPAAPQRHRQQFLHWARQAASVSYSDLAPLFRLAWALSPDPALILRTVPDRPQALRDSLAFLSSRDPAAAEPAASRLLRLAGPGDAPALLDYCDRLLAARLPAPALRVWNGLAERRFVPYAPLRPERGQALTNGAFSPPPTSRGFDWRVPSLPGVSIAFRRSGPAARVRFSGAQPEHCETLSQWLPLSPAAPCRLRFSYRTYGIAPDTGLRWQLDGNAGSPDLSSDAWTELSFPLRAVAQAPGLRFLTLTYHRRPGTTRIEGEIWLRNLTLDCTQ